MLLFIRHEVGVPRGAGYVGTAVAGLTHLEHIEPSNVAVFFLFGFRLPVKWARRETRISLNKIVHFLSCFS